MSRAPTSEPTPTTDPNPDPTPTLDSDPSIHQNHTQPPGPEPLRLSANFTPVYVWTPPAALCLSPPEQVLRTTETGPRCRSRPGLHGGTRIGKKRKMKRQEKSANKRENKDPGQLADAKSQAEVEESQPVCSGEQTNKTTTTTQPLTHPPTHPTTHLQTPPPPAYDPPARSTVR